METINSPWLALVATAVFLFICYAARPYGHAEAGYDRSVFSIIDPVTSKNAIIMDLWNISEDDLRQPVRIFGE